MSWDDKDGKYIRLSFVGLEQIELELCRSLSSLVFVATPFLDRPRVSGVKESRTNRE